MTNSKIIYLINPFQEESTSRRKSTSCITAPKRRDVSCVHTKSKQLTAGGARMLKLKTVVQM